MQDGARRVRTDWAHLDWTDAAWIAGCALLFWASRWAGKAIEGVPGHAGAFWIPALFLARARSRLPAAASLAALGGAVLWGVPGVGGSAGIGAYAIAGLSLDLADARLGGLHRLPTALAAGAACQAAKFLFHNLVPAMLLGASGGMLRLGPAVVFGLHLLFGMLGGLLGWAVVRFSGPRPTEPGRMDAPA